MCSTYILTEYNFWNIYQFIIITWVLRRNLLSANTIIWSVKQSSYWYISSSFGINQSYKSFLRYPILRATWLGTPFNSWQSPVRLSDRIHSIFYDLPDKTAGKTTWSRVKNIHWIDRKTFVETRQHFQKVKNWYL